MSTADPNITTGFGTDFPEETDRSDFKEYNYNIGVLTGMKLQEFATNRQISYNLRITESIPPNKYRFASLQSPAEPRYQEYVLTDPNNKDGGGSWEFITDAVKMAQIDNEWAKEMAKVIHCFSNGAPQRKEDLTAEFVEKWGKMNEGAEVVFGARERNGFVNVKRGKRPDGKVYLVMSKASDPSKTIPGLSNKEEAQKRIAEYKGR